MPYIKDFDEWNVSKKILEQDPIVHYGHAGEVWWCSLGINIGVEIDGKNDNFERPVVVIKAYNRDSLLVLPLTTNERNDPFHFYIWAGNRASWAKHTQVRVISAKRLLRRLDTLDERIFKELKQAFIDSV